MSATHINNVFKQKPAHTHNVAAKSNNRETKKNY